jgi:hypothetical protein
MARASPKSTFALMMLSPGRSYALLVRSTSGPWRNFRNMATYARMLASIRRSARSVANETGIASTFAVVPSRLLLEVRYVP